MSARRAGPCWPSGCICRRVGPRTKTGVRRRDAPEERQGYRSKTELALEPLGQVVEQGGDLRAGWVAGDDAFGMSLSFLEGLAAQGMCYVLDVPGCTTVWPWEPAWTSADYQGFGRPRKPMLVAGQRRTMEQRSEELPGDTWREINSGGLIPWAGELSGFSALSGCKYASLVRKPGEMVWAVNRRNLDVSEPRYYSSFAPEDTPLGDPDKREKLPRGCIKTEFETEKSDVGLEEYENRTWAGWHHHVALCLLGGAVLLSLQQAWGGKDAPDHEAAGLPGGAGIAAQGTVQAG